MSLGGVGVKHADTGAFVKQNLSIADKRAKQCDPVVVEAFPPLFGSCFNVSHDRRGTNDFHVDLRPTRGTRGNCNRIDSGSVVGLNGRGLCARIPRRMNRILFP